MRAIFLGLLLGWPLAALSAAEPETLVREFLTQTGTLKAQFLQELWGPDGERLQQASGQMALKRPGRFRWDYQAPYEQLIVGDGDKVWIFDKDLEQVTVKSLGETLGNTPAAILSGSREALDQYRVQRLERDDGLEWRVLLPLSLEATFREVRLGFYNGQLRQVELRDSFDQTTLIQLSEVQQNPRLADAEFQFTPPAGVDVFGD